MTRHSRRAADVRGAVEHWGAETDDGKIDILLKLSSVIIDVPLKSLEFQRPLRQTIKEVTF